MHTYVQSWSRRHPNEGTGNPYNASEISHYPVSITLLRLLERDSHAFSETFDLKRLKKNYASDTAEAGNPFQGAVELGESQTEWQRRLNHAK